MPLFDSKFAFGSKLEHRIGGNMRAARSYARHQVVAGQAGGARLAVTNGYAKHIGRVGALAVALGVGAAIATVPGVAHADETSGPNPSTSTSSDANEASSTPSKVGPTSTKPSSTSTEPSSTSTVPSKLDSQSPGDQPGGSSSSSETVTSDDRSKPGPADEDTTGSPKATEPADTKDESPLEPRGTRDNAPSVGLKRARTLRQNISGTTETARNQDADTQPVKKTDDASQQSQSSAGSAQARVSVAIATAGQGPDSVDQASTTTFSAQETASAASEPMAALATIQKTVVNMAAGLVGALLAPLSPSGTPPESPTLLGLLAWARQQSAETFNRLKPASTVGETTQVDPPPGEPLDDLLAEAQVNVLADAQAVTGDAAPMQAEVAAAAA
ncbi:MAG: large repetitive protein, partial [Mycobacterium sp.]|nr:large repetitive protein [Mycobacterium sp.]